MPSRPAKVNAVRDLGDGLLLRRARSEDADALVEFNGRTHGSPERPDQWVTEVTREAISGRNPGVRIGDFTLVEDTRTGEIISSLNLTSHRWSYGGVEFPVGRPDLVGTAPAYRRRGLIRAQFEVVHEWSAQRRHVLQAMTGIPYFYRQFGYEMALEHETGRQGHQSGVPKLEEGGEEPYRLRPAADADVPFMAAVYRYGCRRSLVSAVLAPKMWRHLVARRDVGELRRTFDQLCIIETAQGQRVGLLAHGGGVYWSAAVGVSRYELKPGASWLAVTPSVLRYLQARGAEYALREKTGFERLVFQLGTEHPAYQVMPAFSQPNDPYAWYIRVPDLPRFLRLIAPVLEDRLANSVAPGWSGDLKLSFFRDGLRLAFDRGKLTTVEPWSPEDGGGSACFRDGTFLHVLFGLHAMEELHHLNPDCRCCSADGEVLLGILFPKRASGVWAVT